MTRRAEPGWTTPTQLEERARRAWTNGSLLAAYGERAPFPGFRVKLNGPGAVDIGADLGRAQEWVTRLRAASRDGRRFEIEDADIGGRLIGRTRIPAYAVLDSFDQAWELLNVRELVARYDALLATATRQPVVRQWALQRPMRALELFEEWDRIITAYGALNNARASNRYLREVSAPGIHTKFIEQHRGVLAELLGVSASGRLFAEQLGLAVEPPIVRVRFGDGIGMPPGLSDLGVRRDELEQLDIRVSTAEIIENRTTFLSVPVADHGIVIWGQGFDVAKAGGLPWLADADVRYWGDIDTHGFAILHWLRASLPRARSLLMDRATFIEHRDRWTTEATPTRARLELLTDDERALYEDLVTDRFGGRRRLEQEFIDWNWVLARLALR